MGRQCYKLNLNGEEYKLRLTMAGQKALMERSPGQKVLAIIMGAVDDLDDMEALLTEALNWEGNNNKIHSGAELYDALVDAGYSGSEDFLRLCLNIAKNAGLLKQDDRDRLERIVGKAVQREMDMFFAMMESELDGDGKPAEQEGEESEDNPLEPPAVPEEPKVLTL